MRVDARDLAAFTAAALLDTTGSATATVRCEGDGIQMRIELDINAAEQGELMVRTFRPMYRVRRVTNNGSDARLLEDEPLALAAGRSQVVVEYQNVALDFTAEQWRQVELIKDGRTNFEIVANPGVTYTVDPNGGTSFLLGYERGGANRSPVPRRNVISIWGGPDTHPIKLNRYAHQGISPRSTNPALQRQVRMTFPWQFENPAPTVERNDEPTRTNAGHLSGATA